jgi:hypothetical protein
VDVPTNTIWGCMGLQSGHIRIYMKMLKRMISALRAMIPITILRALVHHIPGLKDVLNAIMIKENGLFLL